MFRPMFAAAAIGLNCISLQVFGQTGVIPGAFAHTQVPMGYQSGQSWLGYSTTPIEGGLRGEADWMRGYGDAVRSQAEATYIYQLAAEKQIQNYRRIRERAEAKREAKAKIAAAQASYRRRENAARVAAALEAAQPLLETLEATGGDVQWPASLCQTQFSSQLQTVEICLNRWIEQNHSLSRGDRGDLRKSLDDLQTCLRRERRENGTNPELAKARDLLEKIETLVFRSAGAQGQMLAQAATR